MLLGVSSDKNIIGYISKIIKVSTEYSFHVTFSQPSLQEKSLCVLELQMKHKATGIRHRVRRPVVPSSQSATFC